MLETRKCPQCGSTRTMSVPDSIRYLCYDCKYEFATNNPVSPMRIFLSYGHEKSNEDLVLQIKADLKKRGHDVWFDKDKIKPGQDWRRSINDGIGDSKRVLSILSKHSTRDPGVCLDEIAIAIGVKGRNIQTILVGSETEVKPPPGISHIQWLDMHDWKEKRDAGKTVWKKWYQDKFAEIVSVVESKESRRFAGEIRTLEEHLKPISSDSRIFQLLKKKLVGRSWLFEAIEKWRNAPNRKSRKFWIKGAPGVGKSAFAADLAYYGKDKVIAVQLCEYDKPDHRDAHRIVRTLAFQIATRLPDYRKLLLTLPEIKDLDQKNSDELFYYLLANPLRLAIDGGRERYIIVIDALDEAGGNGRNELVEMLARNAPLMPDWIGIVVTSRPESDVIAPLQGLNPFILDTATESNRADIRDYLLRELKPHLLNRPDANSLVEQILEKSEGVFLYVERFCDDFQLGHLSLDRPEKFPQGLGGIFFQYFKRKFPDLETFRKDIRPALRAILAAREPLPVEILQRLFHWQDEELRDFTRPIASLFPVTTESGHEVIKLYHKSLADWLVDEAKSGFYFVSVPEGQRALADYCFKRLQHESSSTINPFLENYCQKHLLFHLKSCGRWKDIVTCISTPGLFIKISPTAYGIMYDKGTLDSPDYNAPSHHELTLISAERTSILTTAGNEYLTAKLYLLSPSERESVAWSLAKAFADRACDVSSKIASFKIPWKETGDLLLKTDATAFEDFRATFYSFVYLSGTSAAFAIAACEVPHEGEMNLHHFLERYERIRKLLFDLSYSGSHLTGLSGKLEDDAMGLCEAWERLLALAE